MNMVVQQQRQLLVERLTRAGYPYLATLVLSAPVVLVEGLAREIARFVSSDGQAVDHG